MLYPDPNPDPNTGPAPLRGIYIEPTGWVFPRADPVSGTRGDGGVLAVPAILDAKKCP